MACEKRPFLCVILVLGLMALFFHLVGFVTPGWLVMKLSVVSESRHTTFLEADIVEKGGVNPPEKEEAKPELFRRRRDTEVDIVETGVIEESDEFKEWMVETTIEIKVFDVTTHYGLWYSYVCVHDRTKDLDGKHDSDSSSSDDDDDKKKGHCHCRKVSTKCALYNSFIYEDPIDYINPGPPADRVLSTKNFGYASLCENRIENTIALGCMLLGLISAVIGFHRADKGKCAGVMCLLFMLAAAFVVIVPVARHGHYSVYKHTQRVPVTVRVPYSVIASGLGSLFALITAFVTVCGLVKKSPRQTPGKWYQFNNELDLHNELELPNEKDGKKPRLVFITDQLPEKPGLEDSEKEPIA